MYKRHLLVTTALVSLVAGSAFADGMPSRGLDVTLGGVLDTQLGVRAQGSSKEKNGLVTRGITRNNDELAIDSRAAIWLDAKGKTSNGIRFGAHVGIGTTVTSNNNTAQHYMHRTYGWLEEKDMGKLEFGSNEGAGDAMFLGAGSIATATGGVNGDWWKYLELNTTIAGGGTAAVKAVNFILNPALPLDNDISFQTGVPGGAGIVHSTGTREKSRKITYFTPVFNGFQGGLSYIPDASNIGSFANVPQNSAPLYGEKHGVSAGITWNGKFDKDHKLNLSLTGEWADLQEPTSAAATVKGEDTVAVAIGGTYMWKNELSLAGSFGWLGETGYFKTLTTGSKKVSDAWFATLGAAYEWDKYKVSLTGMISERNKNDAYLISLGAEYYWAPGLMPYAEVTYMNMKQKRDGGTLAGSTISSIGGAPIPEFESSEEIGSISNPNTANTVATTNLKNNGTAFILGTKIKF